MWTDYPQFVLEAFSCGCADAIRRNKYINKSAKLTFERVFHEFCQLTLFVDMGKENHLISQFLPSCPQKFDKLGSRLTPLPLPVGDGVGITMMRRCMPQTLRVYVRR